jgi:oligoribonuclease NrnB/cAMP/cGMP phosphodiesterase (DHH superfamily)
MKLVTAYVCPDLDGAACAVAYAEFLQKRGEAAEAGILGTPHVEAQFVLGL